jgi:hypothetical protein
MKVPTWLLTIVVGTYFTISTSLDAWILNELVNLKTVVASINTRLEDQKSTHIANNK